MPRELPGAREEAEQITTLFERLGAVLGDVMDFQRYRDVSIHEIMTKAQFRHKLRRGHYDIIHFAGHALFNPQDPESSAWLLSDGPLWAKEIRNTLAWCDSPPWLVFANACESGMDSDAAPSRYQGDVFGLATAFINQGVAAYIGPLWPIDDGVALQMASDFYSALLLERASLGESLRFAKREAKRLVLGEEGEGRTGGTVPRSPRTGLSWAGLVLYGDPTTRLSESLWSPQRVDAPAATKPLAAISETPLARRRRTFRRSLRPLQAPVEETRKLVKGPGMEEQLAAGVRKVSDVPSDQILLELVEVNSIRY
jgi:CHAT domain-containing protein